MEGPGSTLVLQCLKHHKLHGPSNTKLLFSSLALIVKENLAHIQSAETARDTQRALETDLRFEVSI